MEYPDLIKVEAVFPLKLKLLYKNGVLRIIDLSRYMKSSYFKLLMDWNYFQQVKVKGEVVSWPNQQDIAPETLYLDSEPML